MNYEQPPAFAITTTAPRPRVRLGSAALWLLGLAILAHAGVTLYTSVRGHAPELALDNAAFAQALNSPAASSAMLGARGLYMTPAQLAPDQYGFILMDVDAGTFVVYRFEPQASGGRLHLMAARTFRNDRFLEDWNNDKPNPADVLAIVTAQRQREALEHQTNIPTVNQTTRPNDVNKPDTANP